MGQRCSYVAGRKKMQEGGRCRREEDSSTTLGRSAPLFLPPCLAPRCPGAADTSVAGAACRGGEAGIKAHKKVSLWIWWRSCFVATLLLPSVKVWKEMGLIRSTVVFI